MRLICLALIALGIVLSGYLLYRHFALATASEPLKPSACSILLGKSCDGALQSPMSKQLGIPLAGWGIVYYGTLAALLVLGWFLGEAFGFEAALAALLLSVVGAALSVILLISMFVSAAPFCPLCAGVHVINFLLVPCSKR